MNTKTLFAKRYSAWLLLILLSLALLASCQKKYDQFFTLTRNEEVQLYDGRVIVVHFKFTYERLDQREEYSRAILRDTEMTFDAGSPYGKVTQLFKRMEPQLLNQYKGQWYAVIETRGAGDSPTVTGQDWGIQHNAQGQRTVKLIQKGFIPIPMSEFPDEIVQMNILRAYLPIEELTKKDGQLFSLKLKQDYQKKYPPHPEDLRLRKFISKVAIPPTQGE